MHWSTMSMIEHIYWIMAVASSTILAIQLILACFSGFELHTDHDIGSHAHEGSLGAPHFQLLTLRSIVAFFVLMSWSGLAFHQQHCSTTMTILCSFCCGLTMMFLTSLLFFGLSKLQSDGTMNISSIVGLSGKVYLAIPAKGKGSGKIIVTVNGRTIEVPATTNDENEIHTGDAIKVLSVSANEALVEKI